MRGEFLDVGGARVYYYAAGTRGGGEPVVFLHGFPTSSHLWSDVVRLMPAGNRLVVCDLLGYGRSDRPLGRDLSIRGHGERVLGLFDTLGINFACVVGHDVGGGIAQWLAIRHPARVSRLCLVDSVCFDAWPTRDVKLDRAMLPLTRHLPATWLLSILRTDLLRGYAEPDRGAHSIERYIRPFASAEGRDTFMEHLLALDATQTAVGFCQLYPTFCSVDAAPIYTLYDLFVAPAARKTGAGRSLLMAAEATARTHGKVRMDLTTAHTNTTAQSLYESLGWTLDTVFRAYNKRVSA